MKKRKIYEQLIKQKDDRKISLIIGARQVGKTTILKTLFENICSKNKGIFLDLDIFSNYEKISSYENLLNTLVLNGYSKDQKDFFYLFLDEFQRYGSLSIVMKNAYDNLPNVKIYASGSSSLKIKEQVQESLAGRKRINYLYPLDFEEFLWFKEDKETIEQFENISKLKGRSLSKVTSQLNIYLNEFLVFGGYPEVALNLKPQDKIAVLESIFDLYLKKDLIEYLNIKKIINVKKLIDYLAINNGQKIKYEEIGQICSLSYPEVINYISILNESYLIFILKPFFTNKNKELVKIPKIYFLDNGVRNYFVNNFNQVELRDDKGYLFEGYVIAELIKSCVSTINFWQDKNRHEVDIIIDKVPIEVKFKINLKSEDYIGLKVFMKEYGIKKGNIINLDIQETEDGIYLTLPFNFVSGIINT